MYHGHGGVVIGSEMSGGVENVTVRDCRFIGTDVGLRFKSARGRGGLVENVWCDHIYMQDIVGEAVTFNLYYAGTAEADRAAAKEEELLAVDETTPEFHGFHFSDIVCAGAGQAIYINGLPERPLADVSFRDCSFSARKGVEAHYCESVEYRNVTVNGKKI